MTIARWNPNHEVLTMREAMNRLFDEAFTSNGFDMGGTRYARLPIDAYSTDESIVVTAAVPGVNPGDVEITIEGDNLTIRGRIVARMDDVNYIVTERFDGNFSRSLQLNVPVDVENVEATFENGILTLTLPKAEEVRPKVIKVQAR